MEERFPILRVAANMLNKETRKVDKGWSYSVVYGLVITVLRLNWSGYEK